MPDQNDPYLIPDRIPEEDEISNPGFGDGERAERDDEYNRNHLYEELDSFQPTVTDDTNENVVNL